eukprot:SAG31_NODE_45620_length_258_cov_0.647799_1_plen_69_part_10
MLTDLAEVKIFVGPPEQRIERVKRELKQKVHSARGKAKYELYHPHHFVWQLSKLLVNFALRCALPRCKT